MNKKYISETFHDMELYLFSRTNFSNYSQILFIYLFIAITCNPGPRDI